LALDQVVLAGGSLYRASPRHATGMRRPAD